MQSYTVSTVPVNLSGSRDAFSSYTESSVSWNSSRWRTLRMLTPRFTRYTPSSFSKVPENRSRGPVSMSSTCRTLAFAPS